MPLSTPTALCVDQRLLITLRALLEVADPEEGCALLLGSRKEHTWTLERLWPCCNVWPVAGERHHRFAVDPREQLVAQRWGRGQWLELLGVAHRHPRSAAIPSRADCRLCVPPALMGIGSAKAIPPALEKASLGWRGDGQLMSISYFDLVNFSILMMNECAQAAAVQP